MKTGRLLLLSLAIWQLLFIGSASAQYSARRLTQRIAPQLGRSPGQTNTNAPPAANTNAAAAQRPVVVRQLQPRPVIPVDPEKARLAKEEAARKTVEFQKKRAEEGSESAQYELGLRYLKGDGVEQDEIQGRKWIELSANNGYGPAARKIEDLNKHPENSPATAPAAPSEKQGGTRTDK